MREIFREDLPWQEVLNPPKNRTRRQEAVDRTKERFSDGTETPTIGHPTPGEMTVADLPAPGSPSYPSKYPRAVESWARSVAESRFLEGDVRGGLRV